MSRGDRRPPGESAAPKRSESDDLSLETGKKRARKFIPERQQVEDLATAPPVKQMDNMKAAVDEVAKNKPRKD